MTKYIYEQYRFFMPKSDEKLRKRYNKGLDYIGDHGGIVYECHWLWNEKHDKYEYAIDYYRKKK